MDSEGLTFLQKGFFTVIGREYEEWRELRLSCRHLYVKVTSEESKVREGQVNEFKISCVCKAPF